MNFKYLFLGLLKKSPKVDTDLNTCLKKDVCPLMTPKDPLTDLSTLKKFNIKTF